MNTINCPEFTTQEPSIMDQRIKHSLGTSAILSTGNILHLNLKKHWFDMIAKQIKLEEYREIKCYWVKRLLLDSKGHKMNKSDASDLSEAIRYAFSDNWKNELLPKESIIQYDIIVFKNGYSLNAPTLAFKYDGIIIGRGKLEWGANENDFYFKLQLGEKLFDSTELQ
jgi:hypothetical protein